MHDEHVMASVIVSRHDAALSESWWLEVGTRKSQHVHVFRIFYITYVDMQSIQLVSRYSLNQWSFSFEVAAFFIKTSAGVPEQSVRGAAGIGIDRPVDWSWTESVELALTTYDRTRIDLQDRAGARSHLTCLSCSHSRAS